MVEWEEIEHTTMWDHCEDHGYGYWDCYDNYDSDGDGQDDSWSYGTYDIGDCYNETTHWDCIDGYEIPWIGEGNHSMELEIEADTNLSYLASVGVEIWDSYWYEQNEFLEYFNATDSDGDGVGHHTMEIYIVVENHTCGAEIWAFLDGVEWDGNSTSSSWMVGMSQFVFETPCMEPEMPTLHFEEYEGSDMIEYIPEYMEWNYPSLAAGDLSISINYSVEGDTDYRLSGIDEFCTQMGCTEDPWEFTFDTDEDWTWYHATGSIEVSEYDCDINLGFNLEIIEWSADGSSYSVVEAVWEDIWFHFWGPCSEPPSPFTLYYDDTEWEQVGVYEEWDDCEEFDDGYLCMGDSFEPEEVEIAFIYDMAGTGPIEIFADGFLASAEIAIDDLNSRQDAYNFSLVEYESECDGAVASGAAQDAVDDGIDLVVGALCSGASMGVNSVLSTYGIPHVSPTSTSPALSDNDSYPGFFRVIGSDGLTGSAMYDLVASSGASDIAVAYIQGDYVEGMADIFIENYEAEGGTLCTETPYYSWETDFTSIAQGIVDDGCESLVLFSYGLDGADLITELHDLGFNGSRYAWEGSIAIVDEISNLSIVDGMTFIDRNFDYDSQTAQEFWSACDNNTDCSGDNVLYTAETYDAFSIVGEAFMLSRAFGISQADALHLVGHGWEGASSMVTFNDDGDVMGMGYEFCTWNDSISDLVCYETWEADEFDFEPEDVIDAYDYADGPYVFLEECDYSTGTWVCVVGTESPMIQGGEHTIVIELDGLQEDSEYDLYVATYRGTDGTNTDSNWEQFYITTGMGQHEAEVSYVLETFDWDCDVNIYLDLYTNTSYTWEHYHFRAPCEEPPEPSLEVEEFFTGVRHDIGIVQVDESNQDTAIVAADFVYLLEDTIREAIDYEFGDGNGWLSESEASLFEEMIFADDPSFESDAPCEYWDDSQFTLNSISPWCNFLWSDFEGLESNSSYPPALVYGLDMHFNVSADENGQYTLIFPGEEPEDWDDPEEEVSEIEASLCVLGPEQGGDIFLEVVSWTYNGTVQTGCVSFDYYGIIEPFEIVFAAIDSDGDGYNDLVDRFPDDPEEWADSDDDGVGDNHDMFPNDANETMDSDGDGVGDNGDAFPNDANETTDTDNDGVGDNEDDDADGDGTPNDLDDFPLNSGESTDSDGDGVGDTEDAFPNNPNEYIDSDGDGTGDNADWAPNDPNENMDSDGDSVGNNADAFPYDASETKDTDDDGIGDNADDDADGDGIPDEGVDPVDEEDGGGILPGFTALTGLASVLGAAILVAGRRKD